ncbi:Late expression factor 2 [Lonomia obliqua multiple nucleopolyhedrovirus]|uniref:Late expression factor 2 n=1 Tax=Lonomia obliqua multiple nucleopolyhedrovirus TaxID=134394 RepID=A0A126FC89_9ABAC|nr:Late expression factor 2 [Lonomia obliqua multiple nucleopolyhedrovirus]AKN81016.1 Late expression factor 2 [Lonomia obliqua multiple nucleopolyhedrovirus]
MENVLSKVPIVWNPSDEVSSIDKTAWYLIDPDDFIDKLIITPYTVFENGGSFVKLSGLRLFMLMTTPIAAAETAGILSALSDKKRSKRNICMKTCEASDKCGFVAFLLTKLNVPPCIKKFLNELKETNKPRGGMYRKRFIVNCYIINVVSCVKCNNKCLLSALTNFYMGDAKCVGELMHLMVKSQNAYKPPNCIKIKTIDKLCPSFAGGQCKGANPICNY